MKKHLKQGMQFSYLIVKKCSSMIEAQLAIELLRLYHIKAQIQDAAEEICLLVLPQDYQQAQQLLFTG